jgi:dethiobiotin synthetase
VAGTGTAGGKTWVATWLGSALRGRGWRIAARKPVQSFDPSEPGPTDAERRAAATGETSEQVCPRARWYETAMAPPMAAEALGRPVFTLTDLLREIDASWQRPAADLGVIELVGGPRSPLANDCDGVQLTHALAPAFVLLVADAGLGTINAVRLSAEAFAPTPLLLHLNSYDGANDLHREPRVARRAR